MNLCRLGKEDVEAAIQVSKLFNNTEPEHEKVLKYLSDNKNYLLVYKVDNEIAGFAYGYELQRFDGKNSMMYLHAIDVLPQFRKQGIAKEIMNEIKNYCRKNGMIKMFLITVKSNIPAVALYEKTDGKANADDYIVFDYVFD